jgi:hypothetical protein
MKETEENYMADRCGDKEMCWNNVKSMFYIETKAWNDASLWAMFCRKLRSICQCNMKVVT